MRPLEENTLNAEEIQSLLDAEPKNCPERTVKGILKTIKAAKAVAFEMYVGPNYPEGLMDEVRVRFEYISDVVGNRWWLENVATCGAPDHVHMKQEVHLYGCTRKQIECFVRCGTPFPPDFILNMDDDEFDMVGLRGTFQTEKLSKMGGSLNTESGMASFGDAEGGLGSMMTENYQAPPTEADLNQEIAVEGTKTSYPYTWMQDEEEVVLIANVPGDVEKNSISLIFGPGQNKIDLSCAKIQPNTVVSAEETLFQDIVPGDSSWSLVKQKDGTKNLEVTLVKAKEKLRWLCFTLMRSGEEQKK